MTWSPTITDARTCHLCGRSAARGYTVAWTDEDGRRRRAHRRCYDDAHDVGSMPRRDQTTPKNQRGETR